MLLYMFILCSFMYHETIISLLMMNEWWHTYNYHPFHIFYPISYDQAIHRFILSKVNHGWFEFNNFSVLFPFFDDNLLVNWKGISIILHFVRFYDSLYDSFVTWWNIYWILDIVIQWPTSQYKQRINGFIFDRRYEILAICWINHSLDHSIN